MNTFVIADTHFDHANVLKYNNRPWLQPEYLDEEGEWVSFEIKKACVEAMNNGLIENWNNVVGKRDRVRIIGDFAFNRHARWVNALNGKKTLIKGSHDKMKRHHYDLFEEVVNRKTISVNKQFFDMSHCCQRVWEKCHYGSVHLFGHSHGRLNTFNLSFDVGVDVPENNYAPISIDEIMERVSIRTEEMRSNGRIEEQNNGKVMYYQDDLAFFTPKARKSERELR